MGHLLTLVLASENKNKQKEFEGAFGHSVRVLTLKDVGFDRPLPIESGSTYEENAKMKAVFVSQELGVPVFADDSGFEVEALGGMPGVFSARFMGGIDSNGQSQEILRRLNGYSNRRAKFVCILAVCVPGRFETSAFRGECLGNVSHSLRGEKGFGYDPIFIPEGFSQTFAEMELEEKWRLSHRGRAAELLKRSILG